MSKCIYCGFYSVPGPSSHLIEALLRAELKEVSCWSNLITSPYTLYIGGGTPTVLGNELLRFIEKLLTFLGTEPVEFTVEANPATFDSQLLKGLRSLGVNRLSIGVQSLDDAVLFLLGRPHTALDALKAVEQALKFFDNVNADIIFAVPTQKTEQIELTLRKLVEMGVSHISAYGLTVEEGTKLERMVRRGRLTMPGEDIWFAMYSFICDFLKGAGFEHYEVSNYAKGGKRCLHNLIYWTRREYVGIGPSASGLVGKVRYTNRADLKAYIEALRQDTLPPRTVETLSEREILEEMVMLYLRLASGLPLRKLPVSFATELVKAAESVNGELVRITKGRISLTEKGFAVMNDLIARLLAYC